MPNTPVLGLPYPTDSDTADVPRDIQALANALDTQPSIVPVGALVLWAVAAPPVGWLICNGQSVSATAYPKLAALLGAPGGNVTLPDLRDRVPVGASAARPVGTPGGEATHLITTAELPAHTHPDNIAYAGAGAHSHNAPTNGWFFLQADRALQETWGANQNTGLAHRQLVAPDLTSPFVRSGTSTQPVANHSHTKSGGVQANTGGGTAMKIDPLNVALNYIMRAA